MIHHSTNLNNIQKKSISIHYERKSLNQLNWIFLFKIFFEFCFRFLNQFPQFSILVLNSSQFFYHCGIRFSVPLIARRNIVMIIS